MDPVWSLMGVIFLCHLVITGLSGCHDLVNTVARRRYYKKEMSGKYAK